jgi:hypothetical protein
VTEEYLVGVESEDLRLGETALDLDGQQRLLHLAIKRAVGREKQIAGQLHGECGRSLHFSSRLNVAVGRAHDAPEVDAGVLVEVLIFDGDERVAEDLRIIVIGGNHATLQREGADDPTLSVIEFGDRTRSITFELFDLRDVRRVDQEQASGRTHRGREQDEYSKQDTSDELSSANLYAREMLINNFQRPSFQRFRI